MLKEVRLRSEQLKSLQASKLDVQQASENFDRVTVQLKRIEFRFEQHANELLSLENWVEKYLPLKLQH